MIDPQALEEIYAAKKARRARLARLPIDEKIDIIEQLREFGLTMIEARKTLPKSERRPEGS
jgi:hypothetical protein